MKKPLVDDWSGRSGQLNESESRAPRDDSPQRIGFSGGCHWCTEAVFESLVGVRHVDQGWIAPAGQPEAFSEGALVHFDARIIDSATLIAVHLHTHSCTSNHALRKRYRSAVYAESAGQAHEARAAIESLQPEFAAPILTQVLRFGAFRGSDGRYLHYWLQDHERPFCKMFIAPKLRKIIERFGSHVDRESVGEAIRAAPCDE